MWEIKKQTDGVSFFRPKTCQVALPRLCVEMVGREEALCILDCGLTAKLALIVECLHLTGWQVAPCAHHMLYGSVSDEM